MGKIIRNKSLVVILLFVSWLGLLLIFSAQYNNKFDARMTRDIDYMVERLQKANMNTAQITAFRSMFSSVSRHVDSYVDSCASLLLSTFFVGGSIIWTALNRKDKE